MAVLIVIFIAVGIIIICCVNVNRNFLKFLENLKP